MILAFDTETKGFDWWGDQTAFIATTATAGGESVYDLSQACEVRNFILELRAADVIVAHNLSFDIHQVRATLGFDILTDTKAELHDTDIMSRVFLPEGKYGEHNGFGLKKLAKVFLDPAADVEENALKEAAKAIDTTLSKTGAYYDVWRAYPEILEGYALKDARYTWDLYEFLVAVAAKPENERLRRLYEGVEHPVIPILTRAEQRGAALHRPTVKALHKQYLKEQKALKASLSKQLGDAALGGKGSEEALLLAFQKEGIELTERTESGKLSTSEWALEKHKAQHPVLVEYLEYRHVNKFLSTYIEVMLDRDEIHPSFRQIGAWTGRMSCMRPNMQNIPVRSGPEVRAGIVARPGYKLIVSDYAQIEMRVLAYYLGKEGTSYRELISSGADPHAFMAAELANRGVAPWAGMGTTPEDFDKEGPNGKLRSNARHTLFAIMYGAGGCKLCQQLNMDTGPALTEDDWVVQRGYKQEGEPSCKQGADLAKAVKGSVPGYMSLMKRVRAKIEAHGYITTYLGRKQAVARDKGYVGMSALVQGTAADVMKMGVQRADAALRPYEGHILLVVHDEIVAEVPEDQAEAALYDLQTAMENAVQFDPPLLTSGVICDNYGEAK